MPFKLLVTSTVLSIGLLYGTTASAAGVCGTGVVTEVREGGFNNDNLYVRINGTSPEGGVAGTLWRTVWVRYRANTLSAERLNAIRSLAYLAFASGKSAYAYSHTAEGCENATEFSLYDETEVSDPRLNGIQN